MFKLLKLYRFFVPNLHFITAGGSSGSSSTTPVLTPEQSELLKFQTQQLKDVFMPAYTSTVQGAKDALYGTAANTLPAMQTALNAAETGGATSLQQGASALNAGVQGLGSLFGPQYKQEQIDAALQAGRESAREAQAGQNAMYGAAGGLGSSRMALADRNLSSLNAQRQATAAANASAGVEANRAAAASQLGLLGTQNIGQGANLYANRIGMAQTPLDAYSKYASIIFGTPSATNPNFTGTQGSTSTGSSTKVGLAFPG
jgi:hypothetical protein